MQTWVELAFGDGAYVFKLGLPQIEEIQRKCGPIGKVFSRLLAGRYVMEGESIGNPAEAEYGLMDCLEPIRQGLIGGGQGIVDGQTIRVTPQLANQLLAAYAYPARPLNESWTLAVAIMNACLQGFEPPSVKKNTVTPETATDSTTP